jgi:hypothetical protein
MEELTREEMNKKLIGNEYTLINFIYWRHFTFSDIFGYCGAYFIPGNKYELDRVFITGEFRKLDNTKYTATFALNIEEIIIITQETANIRWKHIS